MAITNSTSSDTGAKAAHSVAPANIDQEAVMFCEKILASLKSGSAHGFCGVVKTNDGFHQFITKAVSDTKGDAAGIALFSLMDAL